MKNIGTILCLTLALLIGGTAAEPGNEQHLLPLIKEIQAQQIAIAENHAKIEARLAAASEAVRIARIYSTRPAQ